MSSVCDKVAVVTGAGSGIGRQLALELARRGARLAVSDINESGLAETAGQITAIGAEVHAAPLDVSDRAAVHAYATTVVTQFGVVHQLYNNAGVAGLGNTVLENDEAAYDRTLGINLFGVIHGTTAFLPHLIASGDGHVVNLSSLNGIMAQARSSDYCASKFAVRGFTESLRAEMLLDNHPVRVTVVHPGGVKTNIATASLAYAQQQGRAVSQDRQARVRNYNDKLLKMPADQAARIVVNGVEAGKPRILVGSDVKAVDLMVRLLPRLYPRLTVLFERRTLSG
ncbi:NAD(P)-dependent dehydrogenase (short-subunit alcohol dehydrogenase family) [Actinoplanes lutulentus]|uniref:Short-subunit dehydrogenase n=1 Tax=Actinoplanes lutulentus TaxID=1287878 RepID=A0A327Z4E2_9ACTN|nr:SDR family NAD(P)-dependent oxidoreductase [Actinoplanes lutulentus]MBB2946947.1 NAD(P)-dependent dehydrogenase (short-subunit alcohol dehydrogenase family) [Actinoplanes lutulentus]RAK30449.1 short-subunit dehydrogenase [Actinoplanes lutulentus]